MKSIVDVLCEHIDNSQPLGAMDSFGMYFEIGLRHMVDFHQIGHMLFIFALVSVYQLIELKRVASLVLAFVLGQTVSLAIASYDVLQVDPAYLSISIPITILLVAFYHLAQGRSASKKSWGIPVVMVTIFGLIHGLKFGDYFKSVKSAKDDVLIPLLGFDLGLIVSLIGVVVVVFVLANLLFQIFRFKRRDWILVVSGFTIGAAAILLKAAII